MRVSREALLVSIVVRRVGVGAAPFGWAVQRTDTEALIHASSDRFASMEAAYKAGQSRLADFIPRRSRPPGVTEHREWQSSQVGAGAYESVA